MPRYRWPYGVATVLYCAAIFALSAQPRLPDRAPNWLDFPGVDKVAHTVLYGGLALLVAIGLIRSNNTIADHIRRVVPFAFAVMYGVSDEVHQLFVPNRSFEVADLLADAAGATISLAALEWWRRRGDRGGTPAREEL